MIRPSIVVTLLTLCASGLGFLVQLFLAKNFGLGTEMDAYLFALSTPTFLSGMVTAMLSYVVVPRLVECENDSDYQSNYIGSLLLSIFIVSIIVTILGVGIIYKIQIYLLPEGSAIRTNSDLDTLIKVCWVLSGIQILNGASISVLNSLRRYQVAAALALLPNFGVLLLLSCVQELSTVYIAWSMLFGVTISTLICFMLLKEKISSKPWTYYQSHEMLRLALSSPYAALAMSSFSSYAIIDAYWAPQAEEGTLATLGYAQRLLIAMGNLVVVGPIAVLTPRFSKLISNNEIVEFNRIFIKTQIFTASGSVLIVIIFYLYGVDIVKFLFMRGMFGIEDTQKLVDALNYMLLGMIAMLMSAISIRAIFCWPKLMRKGASIGVLWSLVYFVISGALLKYGAVGISIAYGVAWFCILLLCFYIVYTESSKLKRLNNLNII